MEQWLIVGLSGVTCSGKSTLAQSLFKHFKEQSGNEIKAGIKLNRVELMNQDKYILPADDPKHQKVEKLNNHLNTEIIECVDMNKMENDIMEILGNKFVVYQSQTSRSSGLVSDKHRVNLSQNSHASNQQHFEGDGVQAVKQNILLNILIIEGFLIFNHPVTFNLCSVKFHLHVPYEVCYARRSKRIYKRPDVPGTLRLQTLFLNDISNISLGYFEMILWPEYERHLREFKDRKDVMFLQGEIPPEDSFQLVLKSLIDEI